MIHIHQTHPHQNNPIFIYSKFKEVIIKKSQWVTNTLQIHDYHDFHDYHDYDILGSINFKEINFFDFIVKLSINYYNYKFMEFQQSKNYFKVHQLVQINRIKF